MYPPYFSKIRPCTRREVELRFGPNGAAKLWVQLLIPPGDGPFPVFITQHNHRAWARIALRRGYIGVVYAGSDSRDDTATFVDAFPEHDWSKLTRRAWAAGRCIDYLEHALPQARIDQIAITGHSRNGKMSLDEAYARVRSGEVWLMDCDIPEYVQAYRWNHEPKRPRKLLLHRRDLHQGLFGLGTA